MIAETGLIGRAISGFLKLWGTISKRKSAGRWVGTWEPYTLVGRNLDKPMQGGAATVTLPSLWTGSAKLDFECYECDAQGNPTRRQTGHIRLDDDDPSAATRVGRYTDSAEVYEQRLTMLDENTILIIPIPGRSTLGDAYAKHGWRRKQSSPSAGIG